MKKIFALLLSVMVLTLFGTAFAQEESPADREAAVHKRIAEHMSKRYEAQLQSGEQAQLSATTVTLSGTVSLPSGGKAIEDTYILLAAIKAGDSFVVARNPELNYVWTVIPSGSSSAEYSLKVEPGEYVIDIYAYGSASNTILGEYYYYRASEPTIYTPLADRISITSKKTLDITLKEAANSVSGTITLTNPPAEDGYLYIYATTHLADDRLVYSDAEIPVSAGQSKVSYVIPAVEGTTEVYVNMTGCVGGVFSVHDKIENDWNYTRYFDTAKRSYQNINYVYENEQLQQNGGAEITLTLDEAADGYRTFEVELYDENWEYIGSEVVNFEDGALSAGAVLPEISVDGYVAILDYNTGMLHFYHEDYGVISGNQSLASLVSAGTESIDIEFPECYTLTGTLKRNGVMSGIGITGMVVAYVGDEVFYTDVSIDATSSSSTYNLKIPKRLKGEEAAVVANIEYVYGTEKTVTISSSMSASVSLPADVDKTVKGVLTLSKPAPEGGVGVDISCGNIANVYHIPEGETELEYEAVLIADEAAEAAGYIEDVLFTLYSDYIEYEGAFYTSLDLNSSRNNTDEVEIAEYVFINGTIKLPYNVVCNGAVNCYVGAEVYNEDFAENEYCGRYLTIEKGEREHEYFIMIPKNSTILDLYCTVDAVVDTAIVESAYIECSTSWQDAKTDKDLYGMDFVLDEGDIFAQVNSYSISDGKVSADMSLNCQKECLIQPVVVLAAYDEDGRVINTYTKAPELERTGLEELVTLEFDIDEKKEISAVYKLMVLNRTNWSEPIMDAVILDRR